MLKVYLALGFAFTVCDSSPVLAITPQQIAAIQAMWWASGTTWEAHLQQTIGELFACRATEPIMDRAPCNYFVGHILNEVYGVHDFDTVGGFLSADDTISKVYTLNSFWKEIGAAADQKVLAAAQEKANEGRPVIALYPSINKKPGHIAIVLPGKLLPSTAWNLDVPNSASFFMDAPSSSYVGKGLSNAFSSAKKGDTRLYYRAI